MKRGPNPKPERVLFFGMVRKSRRPDGCWLWIGSTNPGGYGLFAIYKKCVLAHRRAYELLVGPIPRDLNVLHKCDVRYCVNPAHLFLGTNADNSADMVRKGRKRGSPTGKRKLDENERRAVVKLVMDGASKNAAAKRFGIASSSVRYLVRTRCALIFSDER